MWGTDRKSKHRKRIRKLNRKNKDVQSAFEGRAFLAMGKSAFISGSMFIEFFKAKEGRLESSSG